MKCRGNERNYYIMYLTVLTQASVVKILSMCILILEVALDKTVLKWTVENSASPHAKSVLSVRKRITLILREPIPQVIRNNITRNTPNDN